MINYLNIYYDIKLKLRFIKYDTLKKGHIYVYVDIYKSQKKKKKKKKHFEFINFFLIWN